MVGLDISIVEPRRNVLTVLVMNEKLHQATPQINQLVEGDSSAIEIYWICVELSQCSVFCHVTTLNNV
jgi:hypothetical protein